MSTLYHHFTRPTITLRLGRFRREVATTTMLLALILLFGAIFRFAALDRWSLWTDEYHTIRMASAINQLHELGPPDQHPPLFHFITSQLVTVSSDEIWLRLPSAISSFLAIMLVWKTGVVLGGRRLGLMAAALAAFSPLLIWYAREARMYGVATSFWAASIYFYVQSFKRDSWWDTVGVVAATLGALLLTYSSLGLWLIELALAVIFWYLAGHQWGRLLRWLLAQAAIGAGFAVWIPFMSTQLRRSPSFNWQLPFADLSATLGQALQIGSAAGLALLILSALVSLVVVSHPRLLDFFHRRTTVAAAVLALVYLVVLVMGTIPRGLSIRRQLLVFLLPLIIAAAWGVVALHRRWLPPAIIALAFVLSGYTFLSQPYEDWRGVTNYLAEHVETDDVLFLHPWWRRSALEYYDPGELGKRTIAGEADWPAGEPVPFPSGTDVWVVVNNHPTATADTNRLWARFEQVGTLVTRAQFPSYIEVRHYRVQ